METVGVNSWYQVRLLFGLQHDRFLDQAVLSETRLAAQGLASMPLNQAKSKSEPRAQSAILARQLVAAHPSAPVTPLAVRTGRAGSAGRPSTAHVSSTNLEFDPQVPQATPLQGPSHPHG